VVRFPQEKKTENRAEILLGSFLGFKIEEWVLINNLVANFQLTSYNQFMRQKKHKNIWQAN
jgi:hypothetical protein